MRKVSYIIFLSFFVYSCENSTLKDRNLELEKENKVAYMKIDSIQQLDAFKFNTILLKESGTPNDTILISAYLNFTTNSNSDFWKSMGKHRIFTIKARSAKQSIEKQIFGTWEWTLTDGEWGIFDPPLTTNKKRKIIINEDYTIQYFENGIETKKDSFYLTTLKEEPVANKFHSIINFINQKTAEGYKINGKGNNQTLTFYTPWIWGLDFPSEVYRKVTK